MHLKCTKCGESYSVDGMIYYCKRCHFPLEVEYDYQEIAEILSKREIAKREWSIWRYKELLPIKDPASIVSLSEGGTPLRRSRRLAEYLGLTQLYIKDETRNPTWSFKDRGSSVGVSKALELGANAVGCASSGNMAASMAAYAAVAALRCIILVPSGTPWEKIAQMLICGADVISVDKPYPEICNVGIETSGKHGVYWVHNDAPMRVEGQKTSSFEIAEQLVWAVPDWIVIPTSSGGNMSAHWKAWKELNCLGLVDGVPAMVVAQAEGCSPIVKAFREKKDKTSSFGEAKTIASAIANPDPPSGERVLKILKDSRGAAEAVSDDEILDAQERLAKTEGLFAEPAGAVSVAAMSRLISEGKMDKNDRIVCVITGSGLKDIKNAVRSSGEHAKVKSWDDYEKLIDGIFSGSPRSQRPLPWGSFAC